MAGKTSTKTDAEKAAAAAAKQATFKKLAEKRLENAVKQIHLIGNLASYKPSDAQRDFIFKTLGEACTTSLGRFQGKASASSIVIPD